MNHTLITPECNQCFSYKPHTDSGQKCCRTIECNYELRSTIANTKPNMICGASFQTLLNTEIDNLNRCNSAQNTSNVSTINSLNQSAISSQLTSQLLNYGKTRYLPYQRLPTPFIPESVLKMQRESVNVGVPRTIAQPCSGT